jgi:hypothetical protein
MLTERVPMRCQLSAANQGKVLSNGWSRRRNSVKLDGAEQQDCGWIAEGFATPDLVAARELLAEPPPSEYRVLQSELGRESSWL